MGTLRVTMLGCGSSGGVPRATGEWGACDPAEPKNRRSRCGLLLQKWSGAAGLAEQATTVLIDTSPDLREQLIEAGVDRLDGVIYTHEHADHTHGIDDLRALYMSRQRLIDVYVDEPTWRVLLMRFGYCFVTPPGSNYPPIAKEHRIRPGEPVAIKGEGGSIIALPFLQSHGDIQSLGFRFGGVAYSSDLVDLPPESVEALEGLDLWIVDALRDRPHPSHFSVDQALSWIERLKPKRAILTNLHSDLDFEALKARLPAHVEPAYDGLQVTVDATVAA